MNEFETSYDRLIDAIMKKKDSSASMLVELVNKYSQNEKVQSEAKLLKSEFVSCDDNLQIKSILFNNMLKIAEKIKNKPDETINENDKERIKEYWIGKRKGKDIIFSCQGVYKNYSASNFQLKDISLDLKAGEVTGVVGENGNGKSTLLKIVSGEMLVDKGNISYGILQKNANLKWEEVKPKIAYLSQELGMLIGPVRRSIQYSAALHGIKGSENDSEVNYIIQRLGLNKYKNATWQQLSGGYKLRFSLATILVWKPKLLVLDEPLANLDINTQIKVLNDIKDFSKSLKDPMAIILSSQNIEEIESASDNMIVLSNGEIKFNNPTYRAGDNRLFNLYEFKTFDFKDEVEKKFSDFKDSILDYNGFSFFLKTPLNITEDHFLNYCLVQNIKLTYFQNIGISTKSMIIQTNNFIR